MRKYSYEFAAAIRAFLEEEELKFTEENGVFEFSRSAPWPVSTLRYQIYVGGTDFVVCGILPLSPDLDNEKMMSEYYKFIVQVNDGISNGNFSFDSESGRTRYKVYVNCAGLQEFPEEIFRSSLFCVYTMCKRYAKGFGKIIFADMSADEAMDLYEASFGFNPLEKHFFFTPAREEDDEDSFDAVVELDDDENFCPDDYDDEDIPEPPVRVIPRRRRENALADLDDEYDCDFDDSDGEALPEEACLEDGDEEREFEPYEDEDVVDLMEQLHKFLMMNWEDENDD